MCENELPTSRLSEVMQTDRQTYIQTYVSEIIYHVASRMVNNLCPMMTKPMLIVLQFFLDI